MNCAEHIELGAVGTCNSCGRGLCPECVSVFTPPLCGNCALAINQNVSTSLWKQLALMAALGIVTPVLLWGHVPPADLVLYSLMAAFFPPGWSFLRRYFAPSGGYIFMSMRWLNLAMQAGAAAVIGIVVGPIYLYKAWKELKTVRDTQRSMGGQ